jgi:hypothetical protein
MMPGAAKLARTRRTRMNRNVNQETARIYQFPAGGQAALGGPNSGKVDGAADQKSQPVTEIISASGWYHEEAIRDAKPGREH